MRLENAWIEYRNKKPFRNPSGTDQEKFYNLTANIKPTEKEVLDGPKDLNESVSYLIIILDTA